MLNSFANSLSQIAVHLRSQYLKFSYALKCEGIDFHKSVRLSDKTRIRCTDGGTIKFSEGTHVDFGAFIVARTGQVLIGKNSYIGVCSVITALDSVTIGDNALIAEHVTIRDQDHNIHSGGLINQAGMTSSPIVIGENVWIGAKSTITQGVTIGSNSVIGANSVVTRDIPENVIAVGAPCRVLRPRDPIPRNPIEIVTKD